MCARSLRVFIYIVQLTWKSCSLIGQLGTQDYYNNITAHALMLAMTNFTISENFCKDLTAAASLYLDCEVGKVTI